MRSIVLSALAASALIGGASLAAAQSEVCDSYSSACPSSTTTSIPPEVEPTRLNRPSTLPLTGGELVALVLVGGGAIVGGTAFVTAGRRKGSHSG